MHLILLATIFLVSISSWRGVAAVQRCYVCIPNTGLSIRDVLDLFPSGPPVPLCNQFKPGKKDFVRDCPSDDKYLGCLTETNGTHVTKTCTTASITDCNTANNISYCYCQGNLCNADPVPEEQPRPPANLNPQEDGLDDEDLSEGSGSDSEDSSEITAQQPASNQDEVIDATSFERTKESKPNNLSWALSESLCLIISLTSLLLLANN